MRNSFSAVAVALLSGFALMSLEMAAVRLLAPHFGDSAPVWTNVIGVVLAALAIGAWLGGKWADRGPKNALLWTLWGSSALTAVIPLIATPVGLWLLPEDLPLDAAMGALVLGSLAATTILFAPPALLLGAITPMLVARLATVGEVGRASGLVNAAGILGSLLGTFSTTHWLVPGLGSRTTIYVCAGMLAVCALIVHRRIGSVLLLFLAAGLPWIDLGPRKPPPAGQVLRAEVESAYQFLQVVYDPTMTEPVTVLKINEGLDSFHSITIEGTAWTGGRYYDWHALAPVLAGANTGQGLKVASLGAAAGTFGRLYAATWPECVVDGVEIDQAVMMLGEQFFGGRGTPGKDYAGLDARVFVDHATAEYDVILVDTYERQIYVPAHVASVEFFTSVADRLKEGGVVCVNVGGFSSDDPVVQAIARTMASVFHGSHAFRIPRSRNLMLVARKELPLQPVAALTAAIPTLAPDLASFAQRAGKSHLWTAFAGSQDAVLHDDRPSLDVLQERSLRGDRSKLEGPIVMAGHRPVDDIATSGASALADEDPELVLTLVRQAAHETPYLRLLSGDARWLLHDFEGAVAEYQAALSLGDGTELIPILEQRLAGGQVLLAERARAEMISVRNGWLAFGSFLVLCAVSLVLLRLVGDLRETASPRPAGL